MIFPEQTEKNLSPSSHHDDDDESQVDHTRLYERESKRRIQEESCTSFRFLFFKRIFLWLWNSGKMMMFQDHDSLIIIIIVAYCKCLLLLFDDWSTNTRTQQRQSKRIQQRSPLQASACPKLISIKLCGLHRIHSSREMRRESSKNDQYYVTLCNKTSRMKEKNPGY